MNEGKALAEQCGAYIAKLRTHGDTHSSRSIGARHGEEPTLDQRWISIGATDLQRGFMAVIRGAAPLGAVASIGVLGVRWRNAGVLACYKKGLA